MEFKSRQLVVEYSSTNEFFGSWTIFCVIKVLFDNACTAFFFVVNALTGPPSRAGRLTIFLVNLIIKPNFDQNFKRSNIVPWVTRPWLLVA